jgi:hypothetical protein
MPMPGQDDFVPRFSSPNQLGQLPLRLCHGYLHRTLPVPTSRIPRLDVRDAAGVLVDDA